MKTRILILASSLALLLLSSMALADGRPTGIRITRLVSGGGTNVEVDISVTGTNRDYSPFNSSYVQWIGNQIWSSFGSDSGWQYASSTGNDPLPFAIDWGDSSYVLRAPLFGGGPWVGTFAHSYASAGTYTVTVGDAYNDFSFQTLSKGIVPYTGNAVTGSTRYVWDSSINGVLTWTSSSSGRLLAITATDTVTTGTGIPALNIYGLLAMALVLVGTGVLVFRKPQRSIA